MIFTRRLAYVLIFTLFAGQLSVTGAAQSQDYDVRSQAKRVTGKALTLTFEGLIHEGAYNFDAKGNPGDYFTEQHFANGGIRYKQQDVDITGQWTITPSDKICYSYDSPELDGGCFKVYQIGNCYYFYSSYRAVDESLLNDSYWTARTVKKGDRATCEQMIS